MALTDRKLFRTYPIVLGGTAIACMDNIQPSENIRPVEHKSAGELGFIDFAIGAREPQATFQTPDLGLLLDFDADIFTDGVALTGGNTDIQWRVGAERGGLTALASAAHIRARSPEAFLTIDSFRIETNTQQPVLAQCSLYLLRNAAGVLPSVYTVGTALTARDDFEDSWSLGSMFVDDVDWGGLQSLEFNSNIQTEPEYEKGITVPYGRSIRSRDIQFTAMLKNQDILSTHGVGEVKFNTTETIDFYLRHIDEDNGGRTPETGLGNEKHIKISVTEPVLYIEHPGDDGMVPVTVRYREGKTITVADGEEFPA